MFAALATRAAGQAVLTLALTHLLTLADFARFAVIFAIARLLAPVAGLGTSTAMLSDWALPDRPSARWLINLHGRRVIAGTAVALVLGTGAISALAGPADWTALGLLGAFLLPVAARTLLLPLAVSLEREAAFVLSELVRAIFGFAALGVLIASQAAEYSWADDTLRLWSVVLLVGSLVSAAVTILIAYRLAPHDRPDGASNRPSLDLRRTSQVAVAEVGNGASLTVDQLMLPRLASSMATAQYSVAAQFAAPLLLGVGALAGPHSTAVFETFARGRSEGWATLRERCAQIARQSAIIAIALSAVAPLGRLVLPAEYHESIGVGLLLLWTFALRPVSWLALLGMVALGAERQRVWLEWTVVGVNVVVNLLLIPSLGPWGAALATLLSETTLLVGALAFVGRFSSDQSAATVSA